MLSRNRKSPGRDEDGYTQRMMALTIRCRDLRARMETWVNEHGPRMTSEQRLAYLRAAGAWNGFIQERNFERRQLLLRTAMDAYLEFEAMVA